jgi:hypothetical protein
MEGAALQRGESFPHQLLPAIDQARNFGSVLEGFTRDFVIVGLVRLAEISRVAVRDRALQTHPMNGRAGVKAAGERNSDTLAYRQGLKDVCHVDL